MPGSIKKDLHIAKSVNELNQMASDVPKVNSARLYATTAEKVYRGAEDAYLVGDEERSYVLYMKYFNVVSAIKKSSDYRKQSKFIDELIGKKNCLNAITKAEELSASLKTRYEEAEAVEVSKKLDSLQIKENSDEMENLEDSSDTAMKENGKGDVVPSVPGNTENPGIGAQNGGIDVHTVYRLLKDPAVKLILMDVRSTSDFQESHISSEDTVSVPESAIPPGCTVTQIERHLPSESNKIWRTRGSVDYVVLFDWRCSAKTLVSRSTLTYLKDALFKWDQDTILRSEPLIMNGGYEEWLICYPPLTTNPGVNCPLPPINGTSSDLPSLDSIDYDVELDFLKSPTPSPPEFPPTPPGITEVAGVNPPPPAMSPAMPLVDRSTKPKAVGTMNNSSEALQNDSKPDFSGLRIVNKIDNSSVMARKKIENFPPISGKNTNTINNVPANNATMATVSANNATVPTVPGNSATVATVPVVDRTKKPSKTSPQQPASLSISSSDEEAGGVAERGTSLSGFGGKEAAELRQLMEIRTLKEQEVKSLAEIMRKKKKMEEEMNKEEKEAQRRRIERSEENSVRKELSEDSADSSSSLEGGDFPVDAVSSKRISSKSRIYKSDVRTAATSNTGDAKTDDTKNAEEEEERLKEEELERERRRVEELKAKELEQDRIEERDAEEKRQLELETERRRQSELEAEAREAERLKAELLKQKQLEAARQQQQQQLEREAKDKEKQVNDAETKQKAKQSDGHVTNDKSRKDGAGHVSSELTLPSGWEKKYDESNKRHYYVDHSMKKTYWDPPGTLQQKQADGRATIYKERLRDEGSSATGSSGGLKRSHSSPNIAKMIQDEEDSSRRVRPTQEPQVNRLVKPKPPPQMLAVRTEVSEAKVRNLQPTWGSMGSGLAGLRNLGNTCYMNSTLQCLSNAAPLTLYFLTDSYTQDVVRDSSGRYRGEVASEYAVLIKAIWRGQYKALSPRDFRSVVCKMQPMFSSNQHQDSHELLEILMNGLNEDLNKVRNKPQVLEQNNDNIPDEVAAEQVWKQSQLIEDSIIVDLFRGQYKSTLSCMRCHKKSVMFEPFMCLNLPIPSPTRCSLSDCLLHFSKEEKMVGESQWHCPRCKSYQDAVKRIVIWMLPPILIVHLERFYYQGIWRDKITANVDFPIDGLDMNRYISGPPKRPAYNLFAVSNHFGTLDGGHYTAFCKSPVAGKWFKFDDQDVSEMSRSDIKSSAAYMLFYSSMKMDQLKL